MGDPNNYPVGYDRGHKPTCEWTKCPGGIDCQGLPAEPAPVASRERVAEVLTAHQHVDATGKWLGQYRTEYKCICGQTMTADGHAGISRTDALVAHQAGALLAAGVFRDEAQVKAEAVAGWSAERRAWAAANGYDIGAGEPS